jgi:hypothetical protein
VFSQIRRWSVGFSVIALVAGLAVLVDAPSAGAVARAPRVHLTDRLSPASGLSHASRHAAAKSLNWSGYVKTGKGFTSATGTWNVPVLKTDHNGYSSTWVGIDGASAGDPYLIQTGTEGDVVNGKAEYHAWWEVITPTDEAPETLFRTLTVHPGDSIHASVSKSTSGTWTMSLSDVTTHKTVSQSTKFAGPGKSVEWIQEDTDVNGYISAAPNWQKVSFTGLRVNGAGPALKASQAINLVDSKGTQEDSTSAPNTAGDGFTVRWLAAGTQTPAG